MATIGGLGGLGGYSYPYRFNNPNSEVVEALPFATYGDWQSDWQSRYDAEAARARAPTTRMAEGAQIRMSSSPYDPGAYDASNRQTGTVQLGTPQGTATIDTDYYALAPTSFDSQGVSVGGRTVYRTQDPTVTSGGYTPDFSALTSERERLTPKYENQTRQAQAYGMMRGNGQENAVLGPDYENPNYGQINGQPQGQITTGFPGAGEIPGLNGIDMSWADGTYNPQQGGSGVYGTTPQAGKQWGLW